MWSAYAQSQLCPFPENIEGMCYRFSVTKCYVWLCMCVYVSVYSPLTRRRLRLPGLVGEGLGDFPEWGVDSWLAGVPFTGGRKQERKWSRVDEMERNIEIDDPLNVNACFLEQLYFWVSSSSPHFRPQHPSMNPHEWGRGGGGQEGE